MSQQHLVACLRVCGHAFVYRCGGRAKSPWHAFMSYEVVAARPQTRHVSDTVSSLSPESESNGISPPQIEHYLWGCAFSRARDAT